MSGGSPRGVRAVVAVGGAVGVLGLGLGLLSLYNWGLATVGLEGGEVIPWLAPPDLGAALVAIAIASLLATAPLHLWRYQDPVKAYASVLIAGILGFTALAIDVLAQLAGMADAVLAGEEPGGLQPSLYIVYGGLTTPLLAWSLAVRQALLAPIQAPEREAAAPGEGG